VKPWVGGSLAESSTTGEEHQSRRAVWFAPVANPGSLDSLKGWI
jgi:hypothetical protein